MTCCSACGIMKYFRSQEAKDVSYGLRTYLFSIQRLENTDCLCPSVTQCFFILFPCKKKCFFFFPQHLIEVKSFP